MNLRAVDNEDRSEQNKNIRTIVGKINNGNSKGTIGINLEKEPRKFSGYSSNHDITSDNMKADICQMVDDKITTLFKEDIDDQEIQWVLKRPIHRNVLRKLCISTVKDIILIGITESGGDKTSSSEGDEVATVSKGDKIHLLRVIVKILQQKIMEMSCHWWKQLTQEKLRILLWYNGVIMRRPLFT